MGHSGKVGVVMYWDGSGWAWMAVMPLLWIVLVGLIVWAAVRLAHGPSGHNGGRSPQDSPEDILDRRFASGEIDAATYTQAREHLAAHRRKR